METFEGGASLLEEVDHTMVGFKVYISKPHFLFALCFLTADAM